jgi:hypothetical protein
LSELDSAEYSSRQSFTTAPLLTWLCRRLRTHNGCSRNNNSFLFPPLAEYDSSIHPSLFDSTSVQSVGSFKLSSVALSSGSLLAHANEAIQESEDWSSSAIGSPTSVCRALSGRVHIPRGPKAINPAEYRAIRKRLPTTSGSRKKYELWPVTCFRPSRDKEPAWQSDRGRDH